jgi:hypothetical protein
MAETLVYPLMVQANFGAEVAFDEMPCPKNLQGFEGIDDERLAEEASRVAELRAVNATNSIRVIKFSKDGIDDSQLLPPRDGTWKLSRQIVDFLGDHGREVPRAGIYMLRDQNQYVPDGHACLEQTSIDRYSIITRSEEGLLPVAEELIDKVKTNATKPGQKYDTRLCDEHPDCIARCNNNQSISHIALRGYTFSPKETPDGERVTFSHFPSCAVIISAAAVEQVQLASRIVRVFHRAIKDREYAARTLVSLYGIEDPPIDSVATGDNGDINKMFSWHNDRVHTTAMRMMIREAAKHDMVKKLP